jgi:hypothetical protein
MTGPSTKRRSTRKTSTAAASGRRPAKAVADLEARIADLEERLMGDVGRPSTEYRGEYRAWFAQIVPPEASRHFMTAGREQLLGLRALVDHWIGRLDPEAKPSTRETIRID